MIRYLLTATIAILMSSVGFSQVFSNPITGTNPGLSNPYTTGQVVSPDITVSGIGYNTSFSTLTGANSTDTYRVVGWTTSTAFVTTDYFTWTMTPNAGSQINLSQFIYTASTTGFGTTNVDLRSSLNNFATSISLTGTSGTVDLSGPAFQNLTSAIEFRAYVYGANNGSARFEFNEFSFTGAVTPVPEPASMMAIAALGMGALVMRRRSKMA